MKKINTLMLVLLLGLLSGLLLMKMDLNKETRTLTMSQFTELIKKQKIVKVQIHDKKLITGEIIGKTKNINFQLPVDLTIDPFLLKTLRENNVEYTSKKSISLFWFFLFGSMLGMLMLFSRKKKGDSNSSGSSMFNPMNRGSIDFPMVTNTGVKLEDLAGIDEAKVEINELIDFLKNKEVYEKMGAKIPKGSMLIGPPGTGKTMLAKAIATEANVPFFYTSGSSFVEMYVGVGAKRVRELFTKARKHAPCIIFIDEIDSLGGARVAGGQNGGSSEKEQTLNQLLVELDGFNSQEGVILIGATNRPDMLDPALLRPGRFDRSIHLNPPSKLGRFEILKIHSKKIPLEDNVDLEVIAKGTPGFSGAELANLVNEAAIFASREKSEKVTLDHFEKAKDKILMGTEQLMLEISDEEKFNTAIHEAGHALISVIFNKTLDPVHKVSIIPRSKSLGVTISLPEKESFNYSKTKCKNLMCMMMGGRSAEKLFFDEITTGASNDIEQATNIAKNMVYKWGMSELGPINIGRSQYSYIENFSEGIREKADELVRDLIKNADELSFNLLNKNKDLLKRIAESLIENETIDGSTLNKIIGDDLKL